MVVDFRSRLWYNNDNLEATLKWLEEIDCINVISDELLHELHRNKLQKQMRGALPETSTELASRTESDEQQSLRLRPCSQAGR